MTAEEQLLNAIFGYPHKAPSYTCGNCGSVFYGAVSEFVFCPVCRMRWEIAKWYKPPQPGDERWLKYHKESSSG